MSLIIRAETVSDYSTIAALNYEAFVHWQPTPFKAEPLLVDLLRHHELFDPELSLVAEVDGRIVGHVLFTPYEFVIMGARQCGVVLAPLCVAPDYQRRGIGGALIERGHALARSKGYALSLLCGHPEYYPRFGYQQRMFALAGATVRCATVSAAAEYSERPILAADMPVVTALWKERHQADPLAVFPGHSISQWFSHAPAWRSSVFVRGEQVVGYARYKPGAPVQVAELLGSAEACAAILARLSSGQPPAEFAVALSACALRTLLGDSAAISEGQTTSEAFMLAVLDAHNQTVARYCAAVRADEMAPGILVFPAAFALDE